MNNNIPDPTATTPIPLDRMPLKESKPPRKHRLGTGRVAIAIYTAIVGITLGAAVAEPTTTPAANEGPAPQPTVTVTAKPAPAEPKPAKTVTVTKRVEVVPQVCLIALNQADEGFGLASETMGNVQGVFQAIEDLNFDAATPYLSQQEDVNAAMEALGPMYNNSKTKCREAAK